MSHLKKQAVIYCRVSSSAQAKRGDGLSSQKTRCLEYARARGYTVVETFLDDASGGLVDRPGMKALLSFLKKHRATGHAVLIDDISRLARGVKAHIELRAAISLAGGYLESPSVEFGDDADSELQEYILATVAQHQRRKNAEQTKNRMRARVMNGYWPFACPVGYRYERVSGRGKMLVRNEPLASIVQEMLEGFASGRFQIQAEAKRFLESHPEFPRDHRGEVRYQRVADILTRVIYAGFVESPEWEVSIRQGHHAALVSMETYQKIQDRLTEKPRAPARKDLNTDFPLRGAVTCGHCEGLLTACWSKGRNGRHAYYLCGRRGCESYGKSIRRDLMEGQFQDLLKDLQPSTNLFLAARAMFKDNWDQRLANGESRRRSLKNDLVKIEKQVEQFVDRIVETETRSVITAYEDRIRKLEKQKIVLSENIEKCGRPLRHFDETFRTAMDFLVSPCNLWNSERLEDKRMVLKLAFADRLAYVRNEGFRTANIAFPFKALAVYHSDENKMARPAGVEPTTFGFGSRASFPLISITYCNSLVFI
ncbi:MAG: recombinase family protein [Methylotenera sp.]|nr:recombinase family protein [Methylococcaceae bacterium]MDP3818711.1 recombinase family protein [Methylotenera sp.]